MRSHVEHATTIRPSASKTMTRLTAGFQGRARKQCHPQIVYTARGRDCPICIAGPPRVQGGRGMHASCEAAHVLSPCTRGDHRGAPISSSIDRAELKYHRKSSLSRRHERISAARGR